MCCKSKKILKKITKLGKRYIISNQLHDLKDKRLKAYCEAVDKIKYIFVGDNPGDNEREYHEYFSSEGESGIKLRKFIKEFLQLTDDREYLFLNKSLIYSHSTVDLDSSNDESQELIAKYINELLNENAKVKICLLGVEYHEEYPFSNFYKFLNIGGNRNKKRIGLYYHPSRRYPITKEQQKLIESKITKFTRKVFENYGEIMLNEYKNKIDQLFLKALAKAENDK